MFRVVFTLSCTVHPVTHSRALAICLAFWSPSFRASPWLTYILRVTDKEHHVHRVVSVPYGTSREGCSQHSHTADQHGAVQYWWGVMAFPSGRPIPAGPSVYLKRVPQESPSPPCSLQQKKKKGNKLNFHQLENEWIHCNNPHKGLFASGQNEWITAVSVNMDKPENIMLAGKSWCNMRSKI